MSLVEVAPFSVRHGQLSFQVDKQFCLRSGDVLCISCEEDARPSDFLLALTGLDAYKRVTTPAGGKELIRRLAQLTYSMPQPVRVLGQAIHGLNAVERARLIAFVFDNPELAVLGSTVAEEFRYSAAALESTQSLPSVHALEPYGLYDKLDRSTSVLSGGERHRLAIACAMERDSVLLVLDLTRSNLDLDFETWLFGRLKDWFALRDKTNGAAVVIAGVELERLRDRGLSLRSGFLRSDGLFLSDSEGVRAAPALSTPLQRPGTHNKVLWARDLQRRGCVRRLTFELHANEILALYGPNGCGKTSVAMLMAGREEDQNFSGDFDLAPDVRPALALQYAERSLLGPTVAAELGGDAALAALLDFQSDTLQQHPRELPYSRQKLVSSVVALRAARHVAILDEPSCGMNAESRARLIRLLDYFPHLAVLLFTHDAELQQLFTSREFGT